MENPKGPLGIVWSIAESNRTTNRDAVPNLILAATSPFRRQMLADLGIVATGVAPEVHEEPGELRDPLAVAQARRPDKFNCIELCLCVRARACVYCLLPISRHMAGGSERQRYCVHSWRRTSRPGAGIIITPPCCCGLRCVVDPLFFPLLLPPPPLLVVVVSPNSTTADAARYRGHARNNM